MNALFKTERVKLEAFHSQELEKLQERMEKENQEKQESVALRSLKDQASASNIHLKESQLDYLSHINRLLEYNDQRKMLLSDLMI